MKTFFIKLVLVLISVTLAEVAKAQFTQEGRASFYHDMFDGRTTANGEKFDQRKMTAAHKELPFNSIVKVTRKDNGKSIIVRINDRGPYVTGRIIDLTKRAAQELGIVNAGTSPVSIKVIDVAKGDKEKWASLNQSKGDKKEAPKPVVIPAEPKYASAVGKYSFSSEHDYVEFVIESIDKNLIIFNYIAQDISTDCKIVEYGTATVENETIEIYTLENGKKVYVRNYFFMSGDCKIKIGITENYAMAFFRREDCEEKEVNTSCSFNFDAWLHRQ